MFRVLRSAFRVYMSPFSLMQETPRPWLDPDALKSRFLKLSTPLHPDRVHHLSEAEKQKATRKFSELNAAYQILRSPRERINLLLELETGAKPGDIQKIPPGTMDLFVEVGQFCRDLDAFLATRNSSETSPLLKVSAMRLQQEWIARLRDIRSKVELKQELSLAELQKLDAEWVAATDRRPVLERLENIGRLFSYIARWSQQLEERAIPLKLG